MTSISRALGKYPILAATLAGLILRLAWWWYARPDPVSDFEWVRRLAEGLLDQHQYGYPRLEGGRTPAYPLLLAGLMLISRNVAWLSVATVGLSALLPALVGALAGTLGLGVRISVIAAFIAAINPTFVFFAPVLATEHLFIVLLLASFVVLLGGRADASSGDQTMARCAAAGALLGAAALARADALFYVPVFVAVMWARSPRVRLTGAVVLLGCAALILTPWYLRNRAVIGPGAGVSIAGGEMFYFAHNDRAYGWHPLAGTPLEGLHQLELHQRGFELGFAYLREAGVRRIAADILTGTRRLYSPLSSPFGLRWSTRKAGAWPDDFSARPIAGLRLFEAMSGFYALLLVGAVISLRVVRRSPAVVGGTLYGLVLMNWIGYACVFAADPRYRYVAEVAFCVLTAATVAQVMSHLESRRLRYTAGR